MVTLALQCPSPHDTGGKISLPAVPRRFPPKNTRTTAQERRRATGAPWSAHPGASTRHISRNLPCTAQRHRHVVCIHMLASYRFLIPISL